MSRPPYPHRLPYRDGLIGLCKCGAACSTAALTAPVSDGREAWYEVGRDCPAALREALAEAEHTANAAHDQLSDIAALARGEMEPDVRSGGAPVLGEAWEAVKVLRARAERAEAERDAALLATDKAVAAALEARAKEIERAADEYADADNPGDEGHCEGLRLAARIVRGTP